VSSVETHAADGIRTIVLNRPQRRNAIDADLQRQLVAALAAFDGDDDDRVAILTGADPAFCAGMDLTELGAGRLPFSAETTYADAMRACRKPVIGAVNAAKAAGRGGDVLAITNGGDEAARAAVRDPSNAGILVGSIDYQPYAEGWNFIEAAIATAMGQQFNTFSVDRVLTAQNVDSFYPNDKK